MSIHRLVLTGGLNPEESGLTNGLLCDCEPCQYPVLTFQNQHNGALTLTNILLNTSAYGDGIYVGVMDLNGNPISYPYTVFEGQTIQVTLEVCFNYNPTSAFRMTMVTAEHNNDLFYKFNTECVEINDFFSAPSTSFGDVPADSTGSATVGFTNNSMGAFNVNPNFPTCPSGTVVMNPTTLLVQPGDSVDLEFLWTPQNVGDILNCAASICNGSVGLTGTAIAGGAIHRIEIIDGGLDPNTTNYLACCQPCQSTFVTFQNTHNTPLTLNDFFITDAGSGVNVSFVNFFSPPPSWPTMNPGETVIFKFDVCWDGVTDPLSSWTFMLNTLEHGDELPYTFNMECADLQSMFSSTIFDFTDSLINTTNTRTITFNNQTIGTLAIDLGVTSCGSIDPIQVPNPKFILYGTVGSIDVTWTPTDPADFISCGSSWCDVNFDFTGTVVEEPCDCLCCLDIEIQTENNYLPPVSGFCASDILYSSASFLEQKTVVFKLKYQAGLITGWNIQFNPALYTFDCVAPFDGTANFPVRYYFQYLSGQHADGVAQPMTLLGVTSNAMSLKNWEVNFRPINAANGTFNIEFTFYVIEDYENFIENIIWPNSNKLKRTTLSETTDWTNSLPSVYNSNKKFIQGAFLMTDPGTIVNDSPFKCLTYTCSNFAARFYNKGINNGTAEFLNPSFTLSRQGNTVTDFSVFQNTKVQFEINVPSTYGTSTPTVIFHLFNTSNEDNTVDFFTSSDSSRYRVLTYPGTGVLNNHFVRPGATGVSSGGWIFYLHVDTNLNPASSYRVAAIVYGSNGTMVNTFISDEIRVTRYPDMDCDCYPEINSTFSQYWRNHDVDCFHPVGKERIGHSVSITSGDFPACMADLGLFLTDWRSQLQSVRLNIYKRKENFPANNKTTFFQYQTHYSIRNNAFAGNFENLNNLIVADTGANEVIASITNIRVPWELIPFSGGQVLVAPTDEYMNRSPVGFLASGYIATNNVVQSWVGQDVYFEYIFTFNLRPQVAETFLWNLVKSYKVNAIDFEPANSGFDQVITDVTIEGLDKVTGLYVAIEAPICFSDWDAIRLTYQADREGNFIFFMEKEPFGIGTLVENNEALSQTGMTELSNPLVLSMDTSFDPVTFTASVILDAPNFENAVYRFCGYISSPDAAAICEYFLDHRYQSGSTGISMPAITTGDTFQLTFNAATTNRYLYAYTRIGETPYPVVGETYVFEYSFSVATTRIVEIWFGQFGYSGTPQVTLPIGSTSGSVTFVWGSGTQGQWTIRVTSGTNMTTVGSFKIGNALCP
jgi:hypothetical protein